MGDVSPPVLQNCRCQDVPFLKKLPRCRSCHTVALEAYPGESWESLRLRAEVGKEFRREFLAAVAVHRGAKPRTFTAEAFQAESRTLLALERQFVFMTVAEFIEKYKVHPKLLQIPVDEIEDDSGRRVAGVCDERRVSASVQIEIASRVLYPDDRALVGAMRPA